MTKVLLLVASIFASAFFAPIVIAADAPHFIVQQTAKTDTTVSYTVNADTGSTGIGAVEVFLNVPTGLTFSSEDITKSAFETEVTKSSQSGQEVHMVRASLTKDGIQNSNALVSTLTFSHSVAPFTSPTVDVTGSKMFSFSTSKDVLHQASPIPVAAVQPIAHKNYLLPIVGITAIALLGGVFFFLQKRKGRLRY